MRPGRAPSARAARDTQACDEPGTHLDRASGGFYLLAAGAFAAVTIPRMAQTGMFLDGLNYAAVSRNLAQGAGTFWFPFYTATVYPTFHEQPPLALGLQGLAFALFGDHLWVERAYSLLFGALTAVLMVLIWRRTVRDSRFDWLPVIFWLLPAGVSWSIVNNMLETTQAVFTTLSVFLVVRALRAGAGGWVWGVLAGVSVVAAVLSKGPVGFFPLAAPVLAAVFIGEHRTAALRTAAVMLLATAVAAIAVLTFEAPRTSLLTYWHQQVAASLTGDRGGGRWLSMRRHLSGVVVRMGGLLALIWMGSRLSRIRAAAGSGMPWAWFFLALGVAGSLPIAISAKVAGHYLLPSIPFYALGFAGLSAPLIESMLNRRRLAAAGRGAGWIGALLLAASLAVPALTGPMEPRNVDWIPEYRRIGAALPSGTTIGTCEAVRDDWGLHAYMQRLYRISLDADWRGELRYYLQTIDRACDAPPGCEVMVSSRRLRLLDCGARKPAAD